MRIASRPAQSPPYLLLHTLPLPVARSGAQISLGSHVLGLVELMSTLAEDGETASEAPPSEGTICVDGRASLCCTATMAYYSLSSL